MNRRLFLAVASGLLTAGVEPSVRRVYSFLLPQRRTPAGMFKKSDGTWAVIYSVPFYGISVGTADMPHSFELRSLDIYAAERYGSVLT